MTPTGVAIGGTVDFEGALGRLLGRMTRRITERYVGWEAAGLKRRSEESAAA